MKKCLCVFLLAMLCSAFSVSAQQNLPSWETPFVDGELIVMFHEGHSYETLLDVMSIYRGVETKITLVKPLSELSSIYLYRIDPNVVNQYEVLELIRSMNSTRAAQFNHYVEERITPNDTQFASQWHHVDPSDNDIDAPDAWDTTTGGTAANGERVVACVVEPSGANYNHADLIGNHWTNTAETANGIDDDGNGRIDDINGWNTPSNNGTIPNGSHGTSVSGMIGAVGNNASGGAGVNWDVDIMQVVVGGLSEANVIAAYDYPHDMRNTFNITNGVSGAFVVVTNSSWGIDNANPASYPVWCNYYDDMGAVGILSCAATANNNVNIDVVGDMPTGCSSPYLISVTATNSSDVRTFSGYGAVGVDLAAPGQSVWLPTGTGSGSTTYGSVTGTSFASPCVAGAVALLYSAPCLTFANNAMSDPDGTAILVRDAIFDGVDAVAGLSGFVATGGRLNVNNAVDLLMAGCGVVAVPGCTDATACNFDPAAISNDGSCTYPGCTDPTSCNYDATAGCDDGSCSASPAWFQDADQDTYGNNASPLYVCSAPCNGSYTITINSNGYWIDEISWTFKDASNVTIASGGPYGLGGTPIVNVSSSNGPFTFFIETDGTFDDNYPSWSVTSGTGLLLASGTTTGGNTYTVGGIDCSYVSNNNDCDDNNPAITSSPENLCNGIDDDCDGQIDEGRVDGCMDAAASNYNAAANCDDGSCSYGTCLGDFDGNGVINTADLLLFMGAFGCASSCGVFDFDGNDGVNVSDLLLFMAVFGTLCP
ncbi:MAG: S8 family serine peptidase [Flavobacteriales bacterium]|nr:S8 family serine peptidase [Flavobacteriales bacterium]